MVKYARALKYAPDGTAAHHKNDRDAAGVAAFNKLGQGVGPGSVQPENAAQVQHHKAGGLFVLLIQLAFQFVDGAEKERALNDINGNAVGQSGRSVAQQRVVGAQPPHSRVGGLVDKEHQRQQHANKDGLFEVKNKRGRKGH